MLLGEIKQIKTPASEWSPRADELVTFEGRIISKTERQKTYEEGRRENINTRT